jgi:5-formyltetrahydrofolate cyclo-ligase
MLTKEEIRSKILLRLKTQKEDTRDRKSRIITKKLLRTKVFKKAKIVMFYIAFGGEVNTEEMILEARKLKKIIAVPVCKKNIITIRPCSLEDSASLKKGPYGVCEPAVKKFIDSRQIDLVIVPGTAFDKQGNRLGRGKGCYDRFLKTLPEDTPTVGLAFDFQIIPSLPRHKHDVSVKKLIFA